MELRRREPRRLRRQRALDIPRAPHFEPDRITREVIALVEKRFPDHPGDLLSSSLNLKLLDPREVIAAARAAYRARALPLASVEGFVRQILGWREFIRGVYWHYMPQLAADNHFGHTRPLPKWFWTGDTHLNACARASARPCGTATRTISSA